MDKNPRTVNQINVDLRANNSRMTEQCIQYKMGKCEYGQKCRYAHVLGDHKNVAKYSADEYRSICVVPMSRREYHSGKVCIGPRCRKFWSGDFCPYGQNCHFLHDEPSATKSDNRKTRLCYKWEETGSCPYGRVCCYAHGQHELRRARSQSSVQHEVITDSRKRSSTAAPRGPYCGTANVFARDQDKKKLLFNENKKLKGIYADWIDEIPIVHCSLDEVVI